MASMAAGLVSATYYGQIAHYHHVATYALAVYDWLLCLNLERKFILRSKFSLGKLAYLLCRYYFLAVYPVSLWVSSLDTSVGDNRALCRKVFNLPMFIVIPNLVFVEAILILRTYAFTRGNKSILALLTSCLAVVVVYQVWVSATKAAMIQAGNGCFPVEVGSARHLSGYFLVILLFDVLITIVFFAYAFRILNFKFGLASPLTKLFMREGFGYFVCISAINTVNGVLNFQADGALGVVAVALSLVLPSVLACRLVLNLREFANPDCEPVSTDEKSTEPTHQTFEMAAHSPSKSRPRPQHHGGRAGAMVAQARQHKHDGLQREPEAGRPWRDAKAGYSLPSQTYVGHPSDAV